MNIVEATEKISRIAEKKFGCPVQFSRMSTIVGKNDDLDIVERNFGAQFVIANNDILMPVYVQGDLFGIITLEGAANLDALRLHTLQDFADNTIKEFIVKEETLRRTKILESSLEAQKISSNVVPLTRASNNTLSFQVSLDGVKEITETAITHIGLLNANEVKAHKISVDLHDIMDRRGFLPFLDLNWNKETFSDEILALGRATLFISEITKLTFEQQNLLARYLQQYQLFRSPLIIFASKYTFEQLKNDGQVCDDLLEQISHNAIDASLIEFASKAELKDYFKNLVGIN